MQLLLFAGLALFALLGSAGVLLSRNPVHSALALLINFAAFAVMFITLGAQFLGVVQVIVYAGAIVVLFLFVVMLIGGNIGSIMSGRRRYWRLLAMVLMAIFMLGMVLGLAANLPMSAPAAGAPSSGTVQAIGSQLYTTYILPFELASMLLLAGMLGGVVLARRLKGHQEG